MGTIITILKNVKNIFILILILLFLVSSGVAVFYKIRYDKLKLKSQAEQIELYEQNQEEIKKHTDRVNQLTAEKETLKKRINALNLQSDGQNEDYYKVFDDISNRFNDGL
jgi:predicted Holliday junction resolvase-like endonuclease